MNLNSQFYDVTDIELISAYYKYSQYDFDKNNNKLFYKNITDSKEFNVKLGIGNYTSSNMVTHLNSKLASTKHIESFDYTITAKYSEVLERFYFLISNQDKFGIDFKGHEKAYPGTLYGDTINSTNIYSYREGTNGAYFGFSEKDFTNALNIFSMKIECINEEQKMHKLTVTINDINNINQLYNTLNIVDNDLNLIFEDSNNGVNSLFNINASNILDVDLISDTELTITIVLDTVVNNNLILNPVIYTNVIIGDIIRNKIREPYVLLDISEFNRLESSNTNIQDSYVKIPVNQQEHMYFDNTKNHGTVKYFNPVLKKLDRLTIKIKDRQGKILDSNGLDHTLVFAVKSLNTKNNLC
tara:strand:- start:1168 stop:2235 length:1068 start_codon:yes stop_codon:yes gene_type:complete